MCDSIAEVLDPVGSAVFNDDDYYTDPLTHIDPFAKAVDETFDGLNLRDDAAALTETAINHAADPLDPTWTPQFGGMLTDSNEIVNWQGGLSDDTFAEMADNGGTGPSTDLLYGLNKVGDVVAPIFAGSALSSAFTGAGEASSGLDSMGSLGDAPSASTSWVDPDVGSWLDSVPSLGDAPSASTSWETSPDTSWLDSLGSLGDAPMNSPEMSALDQLSASIPDELKTAYQWAKNANQANSLYKMLTGSGASSATSTRSTGGSSSGSTSGALSSLLDAYGRVRSNNKATPLDWYRG